MKPILAPTWAHLGGALAMTFAIAACVPRPAPAPTPSPVATATPTPIATPGPVPTSTNWMDAPKSPGDWSYRREPGGSVAVFGGPATEADFVMRCILSNRSVVLMRAGEATGATPLYIRTEEAARALTAQPAQSELPYLSASLAASDPLLDAMALTKGRFAVEARGLPTLYLPAWAEVTRVIEDCR